MAAFVKKQNNNFETYENHTTCMRYISVALLLHHAGASVISALFEGFYNGGLLENIFWSIHK